MIALAAVDVRSDQHFLVLAGLRERNWRSSSMHEIGTRVTESIEI